MVEIEYFVQSYRFAFLDFVFAFSSLAAKMSRTSSGDDTVVGKTVPSTTVDSSKGTGTTPSASCSDVNKAIDAGKQAIVVKLPVSLASRVLL